MTRTLAQQAIELLMSVDPDECGRECYDCIGYQEDETGVRFCDRIKAFQERVREIDDMPTPWLAGRVENVRFVALSEKQDTDG